MKSYYRVMLGPKSVHASECFAGNFIGTDFDVKQDLSKKLPEEWRAFNKEFIPIFLAAHPDKTKIGAGLAVVRCGRCPKAFRRVTSFYALTGPGGIGWAKSLVTTTTSQARFCSIGGRSPG